MTGPNISTSRVLMPGLGTFHQRRLHVVPWPIERHAAQSGWSPPWLTALRQCRLDSLDLSPCA